MSLITQDGSVLRVEFGTFDPAGYQLFLKSKKLPEKTVEYDHERDVYTLTTHARFAKLLGADQAAVSLGEWQPADYLFDYQKAILLQAVPAQRFAVYADCGMGKTPMGEEFARAALLIQGGKALILTTNGIVVSEWLEQALAFYGDSLPIYRVKSRADLVRWLSSDEQGIAIGTHGLMADGRIPEFRFLTALVLDESSILKSGGGVIKWNLIHSSRGIPYKLSLTATPAPNDTMEFASQAGWLEKLRSEGEILWTFFTRDDRGEWRVKPHAKEGFYRFMAGWSIFLRDPKVYGWADNLKTIPAPEFIDHPIKPTDDQFSILADIMAEAQQGLIPEEARLGIRFRSKLSQAAKGFLYSPAGTRAVETRKIEKIGEIVMNEVSKGFPTIIWTGFDEEERILSLELSKWGIDHMIFRGSDEAEVIAAFRSGELPVLIAKPAALGFGVNLQVCRAMVFSDFTDSYERFYQAWRRAVRYGQNWSVRIHIPFVPELEGPILENVFRKRDRCDEDAREMEFHYAAAYEEIVNA